jgi:phage-related baseplate assembly protein
LPDLPTQSFQTIVNNTVAGIQGRANQLLNFAQGSTLRAIVEGFAGAFLWFQALVLQLLLAIRLSTANGNDVDTFTADFMPLVPGTNSPRLTAQAATGTVTFSRFAPNPAAPFIPVGATVSTSDGSVEFAVVADPTNPQYSAGPPSGYLLPANAASVNVPVQATTNGSIGNVQAGAISLLTSTLVGVDNVTNFQGFLNGADFESDPALKQRFSDYILGLSRGDHYGLQASIEGAQVNVQWALVEGYNLDGSWRPAYFYVLADDGSGTPDPSFMQLITDAANAVRPLGTQCGVFPPTVIWATVSLIITTAIGYDHDTVCAQVSTAIATGIYNLGLGNHLPFSIIAAWAYSVPGVIDVTDVQLNGASGDAAALEATLETEDGQNNIPYATIKCRSVLVS